MFRSVRFFPALTFALVSFAVFPSSAQQAPIVDQQPAPQQQSQQERAEVLRQAQERVRARRHLRDQQIIRDTYSHKYEAYFGGGYLRFRPGNLLQHINEAAWNVGVTDYAYGKIGITADFRGYYGTAYTGRNAYGVYEPSISQYTFMAGPTVRFFEGVHWGWTAHVLAGVGHGNFGTGTGGLPPTLINLYPDGNSFNLAAGASVDYNLSPALALRLTPSYLMTRYGSSTQNNLGWQGSVVYRWGRQ
ncbi:MAG: hypothetical protein QJR10_13080 [Bacillota bacterium]|nr:hypothetical protein [Bacillota bacterium]